VNSFIVVVYDYIRSNEDIVAYADLYRFFLLLMDINMQGVGGNAQCVNKTHEDGTVTLEKEELAPRFSVEVKNFALLYLKNIMFGFEANIGNLVF
jgi:hypothetical protein